MLTILQALILGIFQGITELFPVSSLGHSVLIAYLFKWHNVLNGTINKASSFLLFLVVIHVATAIALFIYYRKTWYRIIKAWFISIFKRNMDDKDAKLAWLLVFATIPAGIIALLLQTKLQDQFAKPLSAIIFIMINGLILLYGDYVIKKRKYRVDSSRSVEQSADQISDRLTLKRAVIIGISQVGALFAGVSRSGITMMGGIFSGLDREDAARFSFLLATPIILAAGIYKLPDVISHKSAGMHTEMIVGGLASGIAAYLAVKFLDRYFKKYSYKPFGFYCLAVGLIVLFVGLARGTL